MKKILFTLAACLTAFNTNAITLTPVDFPDLQIPPYTVKSSSIRASNGYLIVRYGSPAGDGFPEFDVVDLIDCAGSRSKTVAFNGKPLKTERPWSFVSGSTKKSAMLDHVCYIGKETGLIK